MAGSTVAERQADLLRQWFEGRWWRVCTELTGRAGNVTYARGEFTVDEGARYVTPMGRSGRKGVIIQEVTTKPDGEGGTLGYDLDARAAFGLQQLRKAQEAYGTILGLPEEVPA